MTFRPIISLLALSIIFSACSKSSGRTGHDDDSILKGKITRLVKCQADTNVTYCLYRPGKDPADGKWPLMICFDPHAEGLLPVQLFCEEGDREGFLIAGSNNSKNGLSPEETTRYFKYILDDLKSRFNIDGKSIYLAGFSGGSRVAGSIAINEGNIAGVVGCGAGLPLSGARPSTPFSYLAVGGTEDFNLTELRRLDGILQDAGYVHHLLTFDGPHAWPPKELVPPIFTWIRFDRMRRGTLAVDRTLLNSFIDKNYAVAQKEESAGDLLAQQNTLLMMADYLTGLTDITPLQEEIKRLDGDPSVIKAKKEISALMDRETSLQSTYSGQIMNQGQQWWVREAARIKKLSEAEPLTEESRMYKRLSGYLSLNTYMLANAAIRQQDLQAASDLVEKYRIIDPSNAEHRYMAATIAALAGDHELAIRELKNAFSLGFNDTGRLSRDPNFRALSNDPGFIELLKHK